MLVVKKVMPQNSENLFIVTTTHDDLEELVRLELTRPPQFQIRNQAVFSRTLESVMPQTWTIDDVWVLAEEIDLPTAQIVAKSAEFAPDFFLRSWGFVSEFLREVLQPFTPDVRYLPIEAKGASSVFLAKNYRLAVFPHLTPFTRVFRDAVLDSRSSNGPLLPDMRTKEGFRPSVPIFNVATGPWTMCTEEVVERVMPHAVSGLLFVNYHTGEEMIPGS